MASNTIDQIYRSTSIQSESHSGTGSYMNLSKLNNLDIIARSRSTGFLSQIEQEILRASSPFDLNSENTEEVVVNGQKGILMNRSEINQWQGQLPISDYRINEDPNPDVVVKRPTQGIVYKQDLAIRYLRPPTPPPPGDM